MHLIRNSIKYIPSKDYKAYTAQLRKEGIWGSQSESGGSRIRAFQTDIDLYPGAVEV